MTERQLLFTLDYEQFNEILSHQNWFNLQQEFERAGTSLSQSFLIWSGESGSTWLLADFDAKKTYDIETEAEAEAPTGTTEPEKSIKVEISGPSSQEKQLIELTDTSPILSYLQQNPQGTDDGFIDFIKKINLDRINLEKLKRSDLAAAGFSFEAGYQNLSPIYTMFCEILTSPRESLIDLSRGNLQQIMEYLRQFYEQAEQINNFEIKGENPSQTYGSLLQTIAGFCEGTKEFLRQHIAYLNSKKVKQLEDQVEITLASVEERYNTTISEETEKLLKLGEEAQQKEEKRQENFDQIYIQLQNQLTEKPISQYKAIFDSQAKSHGTMAWVWLGITVGLALISGGIFWWVLKDLLPAENNLSAVLPNLLAKGFFLSLIYLLLNRSIKNYTAEKHLEVINVHRQNALETVDPFLEATKENRETRDQILLAATKAIYDANQSGYLPAKTSSSDSASPVQQIIKEVLPSKSSDKSD